MTDFTDTELKAFLDGDLSEARSEMIVQALERDPALEDRLMALDDMAPVVQDAFADVAPTRATNSFVPEVSHAAPAPARWRPMLVAACLAAAALFGAANFMTRSSDAGGWMQQVAAYQALYSEETIANVSSTPEEIAQQLDRARASLDLELHGERLAQVSGLTLKRAQMLAYEGRPLAQIVFSDQAGRPIALCILETGNDAGGNAIALATLEGLESAAFSTAGFSFLVIGPTQSDAISDFATEFQTIFAQS